MEMNLRDMAALTNPTTTPKTAAVKFTVTEKDVGTEAVRAGNMAELEEECHMLLVAAKLALQRNRTKQSKLDAISESALETAVRIAEATF